MNKKKFEIAKYLTFLDLPEKPVIGVDVSAVSLKMVELSRNNKGQYTLENYVIEPTPKDVFNEQGIAKPEELSAAIQKAFKKLSPRSKNIALAFANTLVLSKKIPLSSGLDDDDLENEVMEEASQLFSMSLDELNVDWHILGPSVKDPENKNEILVCAARKDRITDYIACMQDAGLNVSIIDMEQYAQQLALGQWISSNLPQENEAQPPVLAVVDAGHGTLSVTVYQKDNILFSKEVPMGLHQLLENIQHLYDLDTEKAEAALRAQGAGYEFFNEQAVQPFLDSLSMEVNRALQFFLTQATVDHIDIILLSGGGALIANAEKNISDLTQIPCKILNPFEGMGVSGKIKSKKNPQEQTLLLTAAGLALRNA